MNQLFIEESGKQNAESILFLHASGSSSRMWRHHLAALENDFHCIALDLPGHGASRDTEWTNFDDVAEMIVEIIQNKAHGKPHLVGLSLGGCLILKLLEKHSDLIGKVIVDGASNEPIKGYYLVITMVYLMSLLKNTKLVADAMIRMMQKDGVLKKEYQLFVADLQRTSRRSFCRAMSQANLLKVDASFIFLFRVRRNLLPFTNLIKYCHRKIRTPAVLTIRTRVMLGCLATLQLIFSYSGIFCKTLHFPKS